MEYPCPYRQRHDWQEPKVAKEELFELRVLNDSEIFDSWLPVRRRAKVSLFCVELQPEHEETPEPTDYAWLGLSHRRGESPNY